jgi:hypothetical protein
MGPAGEFAGQPRGKGPNTLDPDYNDVKCVKASIGPDSAFEEELCN